MKHQKTTKELTEDIRKAIIDFFEPKTIVENGHTYSKEVKMPWKFAEEAGVSGPTINNFIATGEIKHFPTFIEMLNACGYTLDEMKISKLEK